MKKPRMFGLSRACKILALALFASCAAWSAKAQVTIVRAREELPRLKPAGVSYTVGERIFIEVTFDATITSVVGTPRLQLDHLRSGLTAAEQQLRSYAVYQEFAGFRMYFVYVVQPGDFALDLNAVVFDRNGAVITTSNGQVSRADAATLPTTGANSLVGSSDIALRTIGFRGQPNPLAMSLTVQETETGIIPVTRIETGTLPINFTVSAVPGSAIGGNFTLATLPFAIPANTIPADLNLTGVAATASPVPLRLHPTDYGTETAGDLLVTVTITAGPVTTFRIDGPGYALEEEGASAQGSVILSKPAPVGGLTVTLSHNASANLVFIGPNVITFSQGETVRPFTMQARDGGTYSFPLTSTATINGVCNLGFVMTSPGTVTLANRAPVLVNPPEIPAWLPLDGAEGTAYTVTWSATDVVMDEDHLQVRVDFGDYQTPWITGASGTASYTYEEPGQKNITVTVRDQDGGTDSTGGSMEVLPAVRLTVNEYAYGTPLAYQGLTGLGCGWINDRLASTTRIPERPFFSWMFRYHPLLTSATLDAFPTNFVMVGAGNVTNVYDSFFHVWIGNSFLDLVTATTPLAPPVTAVSIADGDTIVGGVFSREFYVEDNYADIDQDELPDSWEWMWNPAARDFERPNRMENPDADFLPRGAGANLVYPALGFRYLPDGTAFGHVFEIRGFHPGLNAPDSDPSGQPDEPGAPLMTAGWPGTNPTLPDTDGDGRDDGWEYYFWVNAIMTNRLITGEAYDPTRVIEGIIIPSATIADAFNPLVQGAADDDTDDDGLSDIEEFVLGTNPIDWDTDGDAMNDGFEVMNGLNPFGNDANANPDGDWMARDGDLRHWQVYTANGYDPRVAWGRNYLERNRTRSMTTPTTAPYSNYEEHYLGRVSIESGFTAAVPPIGSRWMTNPSAAGTLGGLAGTTVLGNGADCDGDQMPDGWELYVSCGPNAFPVIWPIGPFSALDAAFETDGDNLVVRAEFHASESCLVYGFVNQNERWWNKFWPTDPWNLDTDGDAVRDGDEGGIFRYDNGYAGYIRGSRPGGALNPCCVDTDMDFIPDGFEFQFPGDVSATGVTEGMDGTYFDSKSGPDVITGVERNFDFDADGLENYQEYWINAVFHFQYDKWVAGLGYGAYDPMLIFSGVPLHWDWATWANNWQDGVEVIPSVPFFFIQAEFRPFSPYGPVCYACTDPRLADTDEDGMDDYYEMFHGLNPLLSQVPVVGDLVGKFRPDDVYDFRTNPWLAGMQNADPDQDGIPNFEEMLMPNRPEPANHHSDPSPLWVTDTSYANSWANLYYNLGNVPMYWTLTDPALGSRFPYWLYMPANPGMDFRPDFMFSFEVNEGYDTDNDNIQDKQEIIGSTVPGVTDPLDMDAPILRKALYLNGNAAARTRIGFAYGRDALRSWTVEAWVKPRQFATGARQIILERPVFVRDSDPMPKGGDVRRTFRLGIEWNGAPFVEYDNAGTVVLTERAQAINWPLTTTNWTHLAATMSGVDKKLTLYIDGQIVQTALTTSIPCTGFIDGTTYLYSPAPLVIGAADAIPQGSVNGGNTFINGATFDGPSQPSLSDFFTGWIDEVRIWDGARSPVDIAIDYNNRKRYSRHDVIKSLEKSVSVLGTMLASRNYDFLPTGYSFDSYFTNATFRLMQTGGENSTYRLPPTLLCHYAFDNLPDPKHEPIIPNSFDRLNGRPTVDYPGVPWWAQAADRSTVYRTYDANPYLFVHWIENTVATLPIGHLTSNGLFQADAALDSVYWTRFSTGDAALAPGFVNVFNNSANPYGLSYKHGDWLLSQVGTESVSDRFDPTMDSQYNHLLPLRGAVADMDVPLWDNGTPGTALFDSDGDGMPDIWEIVHGLNPFDVNDGVLDPDDDGVNNYYEFITGGDPLSMYSFDPIIDDGAYDADGDGISTLDEITIWKTNPGNPDTDDDGISDGEEVDPTIVKPDGRRITSPVDSSSPAIPRSLVMDGIGREIPDSGSEKDDTGAATRLLKNRLSLENFSVEAWVLLNRENQNGTAVCRKTDAGGTTFAIGFANNIPYVEFVAAGGAVKRLTAAERLETNVWVHLMATMDTDIHAFCFYIDGLPYSTIDTFHVPAQGEGQTTLGDGLYGLLDNVRIWDFAIDKNQIAANFNRFRASITFGLGGTIYTPPELSEVSIQSTAFATNVINVSRGATPEGISYTNANMAIGVPDQNFFSMGEGTLREYSYFMGLSSTRTNYQFDGSSGGWAQFNMGTQPDFRANGDDRQELFVFERLSQKEPVAVLVSVDGDAWYYAGTTDGGVSGIDLDQSLFTPVYYNETIDLYSFSVDPADKNTDEDIQQATFRYVWLVGYSSELFSDWRRDWWNNNNWWILDWYYWDLYYGWWDWTEDYATLALPGPEIDAVGIASYGIDKPTAWYPFDDGENTDILNRQPQWPNPKGNSAEDYRYTLDWDWALDASRGVAFSSNTPEKLYGVIDRDMDGMDDWWERLHFGSTLQPARTLVMTNVTAIGDSVVDAAPTGRNADTDGDGLDNLYEFWADTNPRAAISYAEGVDVGVSDAYRDPDGDGLVNILEQEHGSHPQLKDTDDDGLSDADEVANGTDPTDPRSPPTFSAIRLNGNSNCEVLMPFAPDLTLMEFDVAVSVCPLVTPVGSAKAELLTHQFATNRINYRLTLDSQLKVTIEYTAAGTGQPVKLTSPRPLAINKWTDVRATFSGSDRRLSLLLNGSVVAYLQTATLPVTAGPGPLRTAMGSGLNGRLDYLVIRGVTPDSGELLRLLYTFDDGTHPAGTSGKPDWRWGQVQNFALTDQQDWLNEWRNSGTLSGGAVLESISPFTHLADSDGDGIPDQWEHANNLDPGNADQDGNGVMDGLDDFDGDGLSNYAEWRSDTDPWRADSDNDGILDRDEDADDDGLSNLDEFELHGTDPGNPDTDDDGIADGEEVRNLSSPIYAGSPEHARSLNIQGTYYLVPEGDESANGRFDLNAWTVELWVNPRFANMDAVLVQRRIDTLPDRLQFSLELSQGMPLVRFTTVGGEEYTASAPVDLPVNAWTHLAGVWDPDRDTLELFINGISYMAQACLERPASGLGTTYLGDIDGALVAYVDDLRIWGVARGSDEIAGNFRSFADFMTLGNQAANYEGILFADGAQAFADQVTEFTVGANDGPTPNAHTDPAMALGAPDGNFVSLGVSDITVITNAAGMGYSWSTGWLTIQFTNNVVRRSWDSQPELVIFECADRQDSFRIWVSVDGDQWYRAGLAPGGTCLIDLDASLSQYADQETIDGFQYVRIVDSGMNPWTTLGMPGADIDAVGAIIHGATPAAWYPFDDGQNSTLVNPLSGQVDGYGAQDFTYLRDWETDWTYAIRPSYLNLNQLVFSDNAAPVFGILDSDADELPDWWEQMFFGSSQGADAADDPDRDGLPNLYEYMVGTNPKDTDTDNNGVPDAQEDADGDDVQNGVEFTQGTDPRLADTDDDSFNDGWEIAYGSNPVDSRSPVKARALALNGTTVSQVSAPDALRLELSDFDISAWVYPTGTPASAGELVAREVGPGVFNYRLYLDNQRRPVAQFTDGDETTQVALVAPDFRAVPLNAWTHLRMTFNATTGHLALLVNDESVAFLNTASRPLRRSDGTTATRVGSGLAGFIDDVEIRSGAVSVLNYTFDDGTSDLGTTVRGAYGTTGAGAWHFGQVEDYASVVTAVATNWQGRLREAGSLAGGATIVALIDDEGEILPGDWVDTDGDGLPDDWEVDNGLNPLNADTDGDGVRDGDEDTDLDGLNAQNEYLAGTDPNDPQTVNGTFDGDADSDGDGLANIDEQNLGSDPGLPDTDDDGISDLIEVSADADGYTLPNASLSPARAGALRITAAGQYASLPLKPRFRLEESWTIEAWVNITSTFSGTGTVIKRGSGNVVNYELGFTANRPFVRMVGVYGSSVSERIVTADAALNRRNHWYHLAGVYDFAAGELRLYVDGVPVKWSLVGAEPGAFSASGLLPLRVGEGFRGMIDEVRIWAEARDAAAISDGAYRTFEHASAGPLCELRFDDLGTTAEDFARPRADWTRYWSSAATLTGATLVAAPDSPVSATAFVDEDADELPDFWELALFGNIFAGIGLGDPDGDGLDNVYEYRSRLHPLWASTWDDSKWDGNRDFDGDGLLNILEQDHDTRPDMTDTDDDGFTDYQEIYGTTVGNGPLGLSSPLRSLDPFIPKGLQLDGTGRMVVPAQGRHSLTEWTLAAWVRPSSVNNGGIVVARTFSDGAVNYELGVEQDGAVLRPYTRYTSFANGILKEHKTALSTAPGTALTDGASNHHLLVDRDAWTHLAAVYSITNHTLSLFVNGDCVALRTDAIELPATGSGAALPLAGELTVGGGALNTAGTAVTGGFEGAIDDVRIAALVSSEDDVRQMMGAQLVVDPATVVTNTSMIAESALPAPKAGEFLVGLKPGVSADATVAALQAMNIQVVRRFNIVSAVHVRVADGVDAEAVRAQMEQNPNVAYVEPNYSRTLDQTLPNDPSFGELWGLNNTGQSGGTEDADIDAPEAWDVSTGKSQVLVAVIDTGIDYNHPDLAANMWVNPGEVPGNGLDDDGNGYIDDVYGYDFANGDSDPMDVYGHGTHCSGTIGAVGNNATAVAGVNWSVRLMALKIFDDFGGGATDAGIVAAIEYAVRMGARVSNNSYGGGGYSQTLYDAIALARDADHLFVASAGNNGSDNDAIPHYPSSYDLDNIVSVAASDRNDTLAYFSNYGAESVDLAAPGVAILSTVPGGGTAVYDGTSMAGPHVAGAAALVLSVDDNLSYMALRSALLGNVDALDVLNGRCLTGGRLNVGNILPKMGGGTQLTVRSLTAWYRFDDGGATVEDFSLAANWRRDWRQAGRLQYTASMTAAAAFLPFGDTDGDALPDWWEELSGLDPLDATGDNGADADPDGDGLVNLSEYLASLAHFARGERGLNPFLADSDNDGLTDAQEDSDLDTLANIHEQNLYATDPGDADTDDDGYADGAELSAKTLPTDSSIPYVARALTFSGGSAAANVVTVPDKVDAAFTARHSAEEWTVEAWVKPGTMANGTYPVMSRRTVASGRRNYEVGLSNGVPYVAFDGSENGVAVACRYSSALPVNTWTHLAARFQLGGTFDQNQLSLFINGVLVSSTRTGWRPATGPGDLLFGSAGLVGQLLNVRVWSIPQSDDQIAGIMNNELLGGDVGDMSGYLSLSGAGHLKETATTTLPNGDGIDMLRQDWTLECWVRTTTAGGRIILRRNQGDRTDDDFNYYLGVSPVGTLLGRFNMEYGVWTDPGLPFYVWVAGEDPARNNIVGEIPVNDGQWHHVAYIRDANFCYLFVDGMLDTKQDRIIPPDIQNIVPFPDNFWRVKATGGPCIFGEDLVGSMDEVRIWNRGLPSDELRAMSAVNLAGSERGLISYFNFDFQLGDTADERSYMRDSASEYGIYIPNAVRLGGASDGPPITYDPLRSVQGVALSGMFLCNDGGSYVEDRVWRIGLSPFDNEKYAGRMGATATWAVQSPVLWINGQDSDGDGLPDAWERDNGFDPFNVDSDGNGVGDCFDDPDHDGLSNGGEWRAATDPWNPDSDNDGINDYEDISAGSARMNGVRFSDNDYVEDYWENGFVQTYASPERYDEHYDLDDDGWNNWSERRFNPPTRPDMTQSQANSNFVTRVEYPTPSLTVTLDYLGVRDLRVASPTLVVHAYTDANMNGMPDAVYRVPLTIPDIWPMTLTLTPADLQLGHLRQGLNWFYAFIDLDGSQRTIIDGSVTWLTWTAGEPAAVADGQIPGIDIGWDLNEVRFILTDEARSFARLSWAGFITDNQPHTISIYHAVANTLVFTRSFTAPRTWLHEGDIVAGKTQDFGLGWGVANGASAYRWTLDGINRGYVTNIYSASTPVAVTDTRLDDIVQEARPEFRWRMSPEATEFEIEIRKGSAAGTVVYLARHLAPNRRATSINVNDLCVWEFPYQAGNVMPNGQTLANDTYYWKVKAYSPAATTGGAWSDQPSFRLDVNTSVSGNGGYGWCTVNVRYPGLAALAGGAPIRVQAFRTRSFNGTADAEKQLSAVGSVTLAGLAPGLYYFRAYVDQNNNRQRDNWESYGYLRDLVNAIEPFRVVGADASTLGMTPTASITIRDADTDNDLIPDATEYIMWGASGGDWLAKAGPGPIVSSPGGSDYDGDGLNDLSELDAGTSIFLVDTDGDGIPDLLDRDLLGFDPTVAERLRITGLDLATGSIGWRWVAAGTGTGVVSLSAPSAEVFSLGQTLNYSVEFTESLVNPDWQPVSTISSGVSGGQVTLPQIRSASGFYRMRMLTE